MHYTRTIRYITSLFLITVLSSCQEEEILDKQEILDKYSFWTNRDWRWYKENIPFLDTPNEDIDLTYYYRWEMMSGKMVYGSPESGYASTEFADRPWWSGAYGTISAPAGHQLYEYRWFRDKKYAEDYASFWFENPGAEPFNYTNWIGDAVWQIYKVYQNEDFVTELQDELVEQYKGWEKRYYVPSEGMFAWDGMHDGMETNINSRQTENWFAGAPGYRPTLNSYMWAYALAIKNIAELNGNAELAGFYAKKADTIKSNFQQKNWDPDRNFFFHRFQNDERNGIKANSLTYETGEYAGNPHGREEIGFIPWYFNMPDPGFEAAWQYLMDPDYFYAPFGPTTVEQGDPLFKIAENCCQWSGNAWPFATAQTLKAMANVLRNYDQNYVSKEDYYELLDIFARTHRKNGKPYIAEANHPYTGSWSGHDNPGHSDHYFHSSYIDLVITGLIGLQPKATDSIVVDPLISDSWDYFALEDVAYHGRNVSIVWDRTGDRYNVGQGLRIISDGKTIASSPEIRRLAALIEPGRIQDPKEQLVNYAVNNEEDQYFPRVIASFSGIGENIALKVNDGQHWYYEQPANRWTTEFSDNDSEYIGIDFGIERPLQRVIAYFFDNDPDITVPQTFDLEYWTGNSWQEVPGQKRRPEKPKAGMANWIDFEPIKTSRIRLRFPDTKNGAVGLSELEAWGKADFPLKKGIGEIDNLAYNAEFSSSYTSRFDNVKGINDGLANPANRWTAYESPNSEDWIQFDFKEPKQVSNANIFFYNDNGGVQPPSSYTVEYWNGEDWQEVSNQVRIPEEPIAGLNQISFDTVETSRLRIVFQHKSKKAFAGVYEVELH